MAEAMPDWSELPYDLLVLVARCFNLIEDYFNFGSVCKSWHSVATKNNFNNDLPRVPWLMLAEEEDDEGNSFRRFFSLYNGMILNKRIPKASRKLCIESMGWLFTVAEDDGESNLLHPFSGVQIQLPHQETTLDHYDHETESPMTFFGKAVLTASPSHTSDYVLMVTEGNMRFLSFWRPGDFRWTRVTWEGTNHEQLSDLVCCNGQIYAVDVLSQVIVCDVADVVGPEPTKSHIIAQIPEQPGDSREQLYIVESLGSLFVISRNGVRFRYAVDDSDRVTLTLIPIESIEEDESNLTYGTTKVRVYQVDLPAGKVTETRDLGDRAFFLGANASLSVQASQFPGIKPNHIYFTDDFSETYLSYEEGGGSDMGVFNLADGRMQPHYNGVSVSRFCPPTWVTPTLY